MNERQIPPSELIINQDGSIFHLHLLPEQLAPNVLLVGDPSRVFLLRDLLTDLEFTSQNREFVATTGRFHGKRVTLLSTGIGCDNIDIVMNELDALVNIDFSTRAVKPQKTSLRIFRLGSSGAIQDDIESGTLLFSRYSLGLDGLLNWYAHRDEVCELDMEAAFLRHMEWPAKLATPYIVRNSIEQDEDFDSLASGITLSAPGFYGPQGRELRMAIAVPHYLEKLRSFRYKGLRITNFEMEGSAIAGIARLLGHHGATACMIIAQRSRKEMIVDYKQRMFTLAQNVLERLVK